MSATALYYGFWTLTVVLFLFCAYYHFSMQNEQLRATEQQTKILEEQTLVLRNILLRKAN